MLYWASLMLFSHKEIRITIGTNNKTRANVATPNTAWLNANFIIKKLGYVLAGANGTAAVPSIAYTL